MEDSTIDTAIRAIPSDLTLIEQARLEFAMSKMVSKYGIVDVLIAWCLASIRRLERVELTMHRSALRHLIRNISQIVFSEDLALIQRDRL